MVSLAGVTNHKQSGSQSGRPCPIPLQLGATPELHLSKQNVSRFHFSWRVDSSFSFCPCFSAILPSLVHTESWKVATPSLQADWEWPINNQHRPKETCYFRPRNHFHQMPCCPSQWFEHSNDKGKACFKISADRHHSQTLRTAGTEYSEHTVKPKQASLLLLQHNQPATHKTTSWLLRHITFVVD